VRGAGGDSELILGTQAHPSSLIQEGIISQFRGREETIEVLGMCGIGAGQKGQGGCVLGGQGAGAGLRSGWGGEIAGPCCLTCQDLHWASLFALL
jgi:hypothetical protein